MTLITAEAQRLLTTKGFDAEFFRNLATCRTHLEAYEKTEKTYRAFFGKNRYRSFESFRKARDMRISRK